METYWLKIIFFYFLNNLLVKYGKIETIILLNITSISLELTTIAMVPERRTGGGVSFGNIAGLV